MKNLERIKKIFMENKEEYYTIPYFVYYYNIPYTEVMLILDYLIKKAIIIEKNENEYRLKC